MDKKAANIIKYTVSAVIAVLCIWMVVSKVEWASFWQGLQSTRWGWMILFAAASILALVFRTERWRELLLPLEPGTKRIDTWDALNIGNLANIALPGAGELLRCGLVTSGKATYDKSLGAIVMERAWDVLAIIIVFVLSLTLKWSEFGPFVLVLVGATVVGSMATVWHGVVNPPRPGKLREWSYTDQHIRLQRGEEMGRFLLGSTVVLLMPQGGLQFNPAWKAATPVRLGEAMAQQG